MSIPMCTSGSSFIPRLHFSRPMRKVVGAWHETIQAQLSREIASFPGSPGTRIIQFCVPEQRSLGMRLAKGLLPDCRVGVKESEDDSS